MGDNLLYHTGTGWHISSQLTTEEAAVPAVPEDARGYAEQSLRELQERNPSRAMSGRADACKKSVLTDGALPD